MIKYWTILAVRVQPNLKSCFEADCNNLFYILFSLFSTNRVIDNFNIVVVQALLIIIIISYTINN